MTTKQKKQTANVSSDFKRAEWKRQVQEQAKAEMRRYYGTLEALTPRLIDELERRGWPRADLESAVHFGLFYSRRRHKLTDDYRYEPKYNALSDVA